MRKSAVGEEQQDRLTSLSRSVWSEDQLASQEPPANEPSLPVATHPTPSSDETLSPLHHQPVPSPQSAMHSAAASFVPMSKDFETEPSIAMGEWDLRWGDS
jgi:hypothetical protein